MFDIKILEKELDHYECSERLEKVCLNLLTARIENSAADQTSFSRFYQTLSPEEFVQRTLFDACGVVAAFHEFDLSTAQCMKAIRNTCKHRFITKIGSKKICNVCESVID